MPGLFESIIVAAAGLVAGLVGVALALLSGFVGVAVVVSGLQDVSTANTFRKRGAPDVQELDARPDGQRVSVAGTVEPLPGGTLAAPFSSGEIVYGNWQLEHVADGTTTVDACEVAFPFRVVPEDDRWRAEEVFVDAGNPDWVVDWRIDGRAEPTVTDESSVVDDDALREYLAAVASHDPDEHLPDGVDPVDVGYLGADANPPPLADVGADPDEHYRITRHLLGPGDEVYVSGELVPATEVLDGEGSGRTDDGEPDRNGPATPHVDSHSPWLTAATGDVDDENATFVRGHAVAPVDVDAFRGRLAITDRDGARLTVSDYEDWRLLFQYVTGLFFVLVGGAMALGSVGVAFDLLWRSVAGGAPFGGYATHVWTAAGGSWALLVLYVCLDGAGGRLRRYTGRSFWTR